MFMAVGTNGSAQTIFLMAPFGLTVDSDNNNAYSAPNRTYEEVAMRDWDWSVPPPPNMPNSPGKIVNVSAFVGDNDGNSVPNYAERLSEDGDTYLYGETNAKPAEFIPVVLQLPKLCKWDEMEINFDYQASDPAALPLPSTPGAPVSFPPIQGNWRLWTRQGLELRKIASVMADDPGDYVPKDKAILASKLVEIDSDGSVTLYLECVQAPASAADCKITVNLVKIKDRLLNPTISESVRLLPLELMVDGNRDGKMSFSNPSIHDKDGTSAQRPYRFWINDDDDSEEKDHPKSSKKDSDSNTIVSMRDLEDFARLHIHLGGIYEAVTGGSISVGLEWRNVTPAMGNPSIKIFAAKEADGGDKYLTDQTSLSAGNHWKAHSLGTIVSSGLFQFSSLFWQQDAFRFRPATDAEHPNRYLLFEGCTEGKGELVLTLWSGTRKIGEGGSVWLDLKNVKRMYDRGKAGPDDYPTPSTFDSSNDPPPFPAVNVNPDDDGAPFQQPGDETKQCIIYVHGFDTDYATFRTRSQTTFKRLWWRGYKGRFCAFRWPTLTILYDTVSKVADGKPVTLDLNYNEGEFRAWKYGSALKSYVESLPADYKKNLAAHSLGNVVVGSALKKGMVINNYVMMNAAISASCYDVNPLLYHAPFTKADRKHPTPEAATDLGYSGYLANAQGRIVSFYHPEDLILKGWDLNNLLIKPVSYGYYHRWYEYFPSLPATWRRQLVVFAGSGRLMNDPEEAMPFIGRSRTIAVGRQGAASGPITAGSSVNVNAAPFNFGKEHSAPWERRVQELRPYYNQLLVAFQLTPNE